MVKYAYQWLRMAVLVTAMCVGLYAVGQQVLRQSINDVPVEMAEDGAAQLNAGDVPASVVPRGPLVDMRASLSPWIAVYEANGHILESSGQLDGAPPVLPPGVFANLDFWHHGHSWEPASGVRQDVALVPTTDGKYIVAAGRNMREMELHVEHIGKQVFAGWLITLGAMTMLQLFYVFGRGAARRGARRG